MGSFGSGYDDFGTRQVAELFESLVVGCGVVLGASRLAERRMFGTDTGIVRSLAYGVYFYILGNCERRPA
jgi:hypothetical protein